MLIAGSLQHGMIIKLIVGFMGQYECSFEQRDHQPPRKKQKEEQHDMFDTF